ncbi:head GIN domain-containing protein [Sphingomonas sp. XXL09]|uniref:head GIN domain-containing protein n=1 Tax=Sphingomonas sp. XXL09 TaxID=3457787 RepID=UPI00406BB9C2
MRTIAILMLAGALAGCSKDRHGGDEVAASGGGTTRTYTVTDFSGIDLAGADDVDVRVGTGFSVRAEGPAQELDSLRIVRDGDTLRIDRHERALISWGNKGAKVFVTMPRLTAATLSGSGTMTVDRIEGGSFTADIKGSGDLDIAALTSNRAEVDIRGSGDVHAAGAVQQLTVSVAGSGAFDAAGLKAQRADVALRGSGDVRAAVTGEARVTMSGSGDVDLGAAARCQVDKKGSGEVRCGR